MQEAHAAREIDPAYAPLVKRMMDEALRADFPDNPKIGKDGNPVFSKIDEELSFQPLNDLGNAMRFLKRFGHDLYFVENIGWYAWTGTHWSPEEGARIAEKKSHETAKAMKREVLAVIARGPMDGEADDAFKERITKFRKFCNTCGNAARMRAMREEAQTYLSVQHEDFDKNPWLVTLENGTLNLDAELNEDGRRHIPLQRHNRKDMISMCMPVRYDRNAECVKFLGFMQDVQPDVDIQTFLQRFFGYAMTGSMKEQVVMMFYGGGSNGKGMLMWLMSYLFGGYYKGIPISSLMAQDRKSGSGATPDLARLPGARFVTSSEPETGERFSESFLKLVSGEEKMPVRNLNKGFFEFLPQFKLCIAFNNKPSVRSADNGFWRRVLLVPFDQTFVDADEIKSYPGAKLKDKELREKLMPELPGILNWLIDGYLDWRERGLLIPDKVRAAVAEYRAEANPILQFLNDWCEEKSGLSISATRIYEAYRAWAKENGHEPCSMNFFGRKMGDMPRIKRARTGAGNHYEGIDLNQHGRAVMAGPSASDMQQHAEEDIPM